MWSGRGHSNSWGNLLTPVFVVGHFISPAVSWIPVLSFCVYNAGFCCGIGCIPWFMIAELVPRSVQDWANSFIVLYTHLVAFLITKFFIASVDNFGYAAPFAFFSASCFTGTVFIYNFIPETKNRSAEEIQIAISLGPKKAKSHFSSSVESTN